MTHEACCTFSCLQDLEGFDDDGRGRTPISEVASRHRSPFKQRRNSGSLGPGPLASGPAASGRTPQSADSSGANKYVTFDVLRSFHVILVKRKLDEFAIPDS